jgi:hypothetical protein
MDGETKAVVTVSEMARMVGLSRARFYQLVRAFDFDNNDGTVVRNDTRDHFFGIANNLANGAQEAFVGPGDSGGPDFIGNCLGSLAMPEASAFHDLIRRVRAAPEKARAGPRRLAARQPQLISSGAHRAGATGGACPRPAHPG